MDNYILTLIAEYTRRYQPLTAEQRGIRRIIRLQNAADNAAWDLRDAKRELASSADPCAWRDIYAMRRLLDVTLFHLDGGYQRPGYRVGEPADPFYEQARRNAAK